MKNTLMAVLAGLAFLATAVAQGLDELARGLDSPHPAVRLDAVRQLALQYPAQSTPYMLAAAKDPDDLVRERAVQALGISGGAQAESQLVESLLDPSWFVRWRAVQSLASLGSRSVAGEIAPLTEDTNILFSEEHPCVEDSLTVTALVANRGDQPAREVAVRFYDGDPAAGGVTIGQAVIADIAPGVVGRAECQWTAEQRHLGASYGISLANNAKRTGYVYNTIYALVDPENRISESDESNNSTSRRIVVYNKANLVLVDPSFMTFERSGGKVLITALVRNHNLYGWLTQAREARNVVVRFYDGQPQERDINRHLIGEAMIPSIPAGEFGAARVEWDVRGLAGRRRVYAVVDPFDRIPEIWQTARGKFIQVKKDIDLSK